jgi:hypothetical protein
MLDIQRFGNCVKVVQKAGMFTLPKEDREVAFFTCYDEDYAKDTVQELYELLAHLNVEVLVK